MIEGKCTKSYIDEEVVEVMTEQITAKVHAKKPRMSLGSDEMIDVDLWAYGYREGMTLEEAIEGMREISNDTAKLLREKGLMPQLGLDLEREIAKSLNRKVEQLYKKATGVKKHRKRVANRQKLYDKNK